MAKTPSNMLALKTPAPDFALPNTDGKLVSREQYKNHPLLVTFICNHCPYVIHIREGLIDLANQLKDKGIAFVAINSNDVVNYPEDSPEQMREDAQKYQYPFPYLFDESQDVARSYSAACTPDFFLFDREHMLFYRGQMDDARPSNNEPNDAHSILEASEQLLAGHPPPTGQKPSLGCNIKWKESL